MTDQYTDERREAIYNEWNNSMMGCEDGRTAFMGGFNIAAIRYQDALREARKALVVISNMEYEPSRWVAEQATTTINALLKDK